MSPLSYNAQFDPFISRRNPRKGGDLILPSGNPSLPSDLGSCGCGARDAAHIEPHRDKDGGTDRGGAVVSGGKACFAFEFNFHFISYTLSFSTDLNLELLERLEDSGLCPPFSSGCAALV